MKPFEPRVHPSCRACAGRWQPLAVALCALLAFVPPLLGQTPNPVPFVNQPLVPTAVEPGGPDFTLTVNGTGFVPGATINWNDTPLATTFLSGSQLTANVPASQIAVAQTASITVTNPAPGGGTSKVVPLQVAYRIPSPIALGDPASYPTTSGPTALAAGDFNGDGITDLAESGNHLGGGNQLAVHLGNGDVTFSPPTFYALPGSGTGGIAVGDFNKDGKLDLAVTSGYGPAQASVFLGNGDGTFQLPIDSPAGNSGDGLVAGDFNEDGKLDLAITGGGVTLLLGNGDGTFLPPTLLGLGTGANQVTAGDFNGDGHLDVVALDSAGVGDCRRSCQSQSGVSVLLGNGDGTFEPPVFYQTGPAPRSAVAADFNRDGKLDLGVANTGAPTYPGNAVSILIGIGDGTFLAPANYFASYIPYSVVGGDFDADGNLDFAVTSVEERSIYDRPSSIRTYLGIGDGTFQPGSLSPSSSPASYATVVADFNRDGYLDLATVDHYGSGVSIFLQRPPFSISPGFASFGDQLAGTSKPLNITISNNTATPIEITSISITGTNASDFTETTTCGTTLEQESCLITVTFMPGDLGPRAASLVIEDTGPGGSQTVPLQGTGVNPIVTFSSAEIDFGTQAFLVTSAPQNVTLTNTGVGRLTITDIHTIGENFAATHDCGITVDEGSQCTITVTYTPKTLGTHDEAVVIYDNAADSPQIINLRGTSVAATVTLSPGSLDFGEQTISTTSSPQTLTVLNSGSVALYLTSVALTGSFDYVSHCELLVPIAPGGSCSFDVTFQPSQIGTNTGALTLGDNATGSPHTVTLTGTGLPSATVSVTPASLDFGEQEAGTTSAVKQVNVTNTGNDPVLINSIGVIGDFTRAHDCPTSLPIATSCTVIVSFKPTAPGTRAGTLTIADDAVGSPHSVSLTGVGTGPGVSLSPSGLDFGGQIVEGSSAAQTVTLTNNGTAGLGISSIAITGTNAAEFEQIHTCGASLAAAANCTVSVTFKPTSTGAKAAQVSIASDAYGTPHSVTLTGTGTDLTLNAQSSGSMSATVNAGATATFDLELAPTGFSGDVSLACTENITAATCSVTPSSVTLDGTNPANVTVSVTTTARAMVGPQVGGHRPPLQGPALPPMSNPSRRQVLPVLLGLMMLAAVAALYERRSRFAGPRPGRGRHRPALQWAPLAVTVLAVLLWAACGGGGAAGPAPSPQTGTPAGTYTVTVTATSGGLSRSTELTLTVN